MNERETEQPAAGYHLYDIFREKWGHAMAGQICEVLRGAAAADSENAAHERGTRSLERRVSLSARWRDLAAQYDRSADISIAQKHTYLNRGRAEMLRNCADEIEAIGRADQANEKLTHPRPDGTDVR